MRRCLTLAQEAMDAGNPPVGSVLVCDDQIIGEGREAGKSSGDVTCHAEIEAVRNSISKGHGSLLDKATLYTTHEPCIMCSYVIRHHRIPRIISGCQVPEVGGASSPMPVLRTREVAKWSSPPQITFGLLAYECRQLMDRYQRL